MWWSRRRWRQSPDVGEIARTIDGCLQLGSVSAAAGGGALIADAIDELERVMRSIYTPGDGLSSQRRDPDGPRASLRDHVAAGSALLTAHEITGRLPYAMLAEELAAFLSRTWWDGERGWFQPAGQVGQRPDSPYAAVIHRKRGSLQLKTVCDLFEFKVPPGSVFGGSEETVKVPLLPVKGVLQPQPWKRPPGAAPGGASLEEREGFEPSRPSRA